VRDLIDSEALRFFHEAQSLSVFDLFFTEQTPWGKDRRGPNLSKRSEVAKGVLRTQVRGDYKQTVFSPDLARRIREGLQQALDHLRRG
jgi:hypothetical protein